MRQKPIPTVSAAEQARVGQSLQSRFGSCSPSQPACLTQGSQLLYMGRDRVTRGPPRAQPLAIHTGQCRISSFTVGDTDYLRPSPLQSAKAVPTVQAPAVPGLSIASAWTAPHEMKSPQAQPGPRGGNERKGRKEHSVPPRRPTTLRPRGLTTPRCFGALHFQGTVLTDSNSIAQRCPRNIPSFCWWQQPPALSPSGTPQEPSWGRCHKPR